MKRFGFRFNYNTRELGGYPTAYRKTTKYGVFVRSDALIKLTKDEIELLEKQNIKKIVDIRTKFETESSPCILENVSGFEYKNIPLTGGLKVPNDEKAIPASYLEIAESEFVIHEILSEIINAKTGTIFFCSAGKDRTGVISALLLALVGVGDADIIADYQVSFTYLKKKISEMRADYPDLPYFAGFSEAWYMEKFLEMFREEYNSVQEYFYKIGFKSSDLVNLKSKFLK